MKEFKSGSENWISLVPEFYYDLICQVPPGIILSIGLCSIYYRPLNIEVYKAEWGPSLIALIFFLSISYTLGLLIRPLGDVFTVFWRKLAWAKKKVSYKGITYKTDREAYDALRLVEPSLSKIMIKMRAEASLPGNISAACIVICILRLAMEKPGNYIWWFVLVVIYTGIFASQHQNAKYIKSLLTFWCQLGARSGGE